VALRLPHGSVRVLPPDATRHLLPGAHLPALPAILGISIRTQDGNAAIARLLGQAPQTMLTARASGVIVRFLG
jgi:hypothetical protein